MHHPVFNLLIVFILGILVGERFILSATALWTLLFGATLASLVHLAKGRRMLAHVFLFGAVLVAGALRYRVATTILDPNHYAHSGPRLSGGFEIVLDENPHVYRGAVVLSGELRSVAADEKKRPITGHIRVQALPQDLAVSDYQQGDILLVEGDMSPTDVVLPWDKAQTTWDRKRGIYSEIQARSPVRRVGYRPLSPFAALAQMMRKRVLRMLEETHPPEVADFIRSILLGIRLLPDGVAEDFRKSGIYHVLSVSGLHVAILTTVLVGFFGLLPISRRAVGFLVLLALGIFCLMVGQTEPVSRTTLMASIFIIGRMLDRPLSVYTSLAAAALTILAMNPFSLYDPGFQLTFVTTLGVVYLTPLFMTKLNFLPSYLNALLSTSIAASLASLPILVESFGQVVLVGPLTNLVAVPLFGVILPIAFLAVLGSFISPWISFFFGAANFGFVHLLYWLAHVFASIPLASIEIGPLGLSFWGFYGLVLVLAGDATNLRAVLRPIVNRSLAPPPPLVVEEVSDEVLERTARELEALLPEEAPDPRDRLEVLLHQESETIRSQIPQLSSEFVQEYGLLLRKPWRRSLDALTLANLSMSHAHFLASRSADRRPSLVFLLKALEQELDVHLFAPMRTSVHLEKARALLEDFPEHPLVFYLTEPPRRLGLEDQNELLWSMITASDPKIQRLVRSITRDLGGRMKDVSFFFSPSRLPLRLDQIVKKFVLRLEKEEWSWQEVRRAREEILGPRSENLFEELGESLGHDEGRGAAWLKGVMTPDTQPDATPVADMGGMKVEEPTPEAPEKAEAPPPEEEGPSAAVS